MIGLLLFIFILMSPYVLVILLASYARVGASVNPGKVKNWPMISVIMPTYNEESRVARKLEEVLDLDYPQDKLVEAVNELIRAQDELAETITEIYQWAAIYDNGQSAIELPKVK